MHGSDIWVKELNRDVPTRLTFLPGANTSPVWAPDGTYLLFQSIDAAAPGLFWIRSDGSGQPLRLTDGKHREVPYSISPDGKRVAFHRTGNGGGTDIFTASIEGDPSHPRLGEQELFLGTQFNELHPAFSPDGRWLAYQSDESGHGQVYVRPFPGPGGRWQISQDGGFYPRWSRGGRELFFELAYRLFAVHYSVRGDSFLAGKPESWSGALVLGFRERVNYDVAADGKRLALVLSQDRVAASKPPTHLTFLLNFFDELRRRATVGK